MLTNYCLWYKIKHIMHFLLLKSSIRPVTVSKYSKMLEEQGYSLQGMEKTGDYIARMIYSI